MTNTNALLDKARELCKPATDYRLAKTLDISDSTVARCRKRGGTLDNEATLKLATFLQQDFKQILALVELDRARTEKTKRFWERIAPRVLPSLVIGAVAAGGLGVSRESHSAPRYDMQSIKPAIHYAKYVMAKLQRLQAPRGFAMRWLFDRLAAIPRPMQPANAACG